MEKIKLAVSKREAKTPNQLRREGFIPGTLYGAGVASENVQLCAKEFSRLPQAAYSHMIELDYEGTKVNGLIRQVQRKSTKDFVYTVELYRVNLDKKLTVSVPLKYVGASAAIHAGGQAVENYQEAELECLPSEIPDFVEVDMSMIENMEGAIHFGDIKLPSTIKILNPLDEIVVKVVAPKAAPTPKEAAVAAKK
jgi:large subunit ribosomal protein L25